MRVIFDMLRDGLPTINSAAEDLAQAQQDVATGRRLHGLSDDPLAIRGAVGEHATLGTLDAIQLARTRIEGNVQPALALEAMLVGAIRRPSERGAA